MRWKPLGRTWSRKRLMNSLAASVIVRYRARPLTRRIARVGSETGRLMRDTGHVEGIPGGFALASGPSCSGRLRNLHPWPS